MNSKVSYNRESGTRATRRSFLAAVGGTALVGSSTNVVRAAGSVSPTMYVYLPSDDSLYLHEDNVMDAAFDLASQWYDNLYRYDGISALGIRRGSDHDGDLHQQKVENNWRDLIDFGSHGGDYIHHFVVSNRFDRGTGYGGHAVEATEDRPGVCITNWGALQYHDSDTIAENLFKHETLHTYGAEHHHGTVEYDTGWFNEFKNISPMATSYVRGRIKQFSDTQWAGTGDVPEEFGNGTDNYQKSSFWDHTGEVSFPAWSAVLRHIDDNFDVDLGVPDR